MYLRSSHRLHRRITSGFQATQLASQLITTTGSDDETAAAIPGRQDPGADRRREGWGCAREWEEEEVEEGGRYACVLPVV